MMGASKRLGCALVSAAVVAVGVTALSASPSAAAVAPFTVKFKCNALPFNKQFTWDATVTPTFTGAGAAQEIVLAMSDMPGLSPAKVNGTVTGVMALTVDGAAVSASGNGPAVAEPNAPIPLMPLAGVYAGSTTAPVIEVSKADFVVSASGVVVDVNCTTDPGAVFPTPTPTPAPAPTPKPTPSKKVEKGAKKGVAAKGAAKFDCKLQTLGSPFTYNPTVSMTGTRAKAGASKVSLKLNFSEIPGLAPVPIDNGAMKIDAAALVGGKKVAFTHSSKVTVPSYGKVPVPTLTASVTSDQAKMPVEITAFKFDFGEMSGLTVYSECAGGGKLSAMTVGVGAADSDDAGSGDSGDASAASTADTLPKTGSSAPLMVIGLWSSAFVLLAVALFLFLPRRNRHIGV